MLKAAASRWRTEQSVMFSSGAPDFPPRRPSPTLPSGICSQYRWGSGNTTVCTLESQSVIILVNGIDLRGAAQTLGSITASREVQVHLSQLSWMWKKTTFPGKEPSCRFNVGLVYFKIGLTPTNKHLFKIDQRDCQSSNNKNWNNVLTMIQSSG